MSPDPPLIPERQYLRIQTVCLLVLTAVTAAASLYWLRPVMIPFVLALFISIALAPVIDFQILRLRFPRPVAIAGSFLLGLGAVVSMAALVETSVGDIQDNMASYKESAHSLFDFDDGVGDLGFLQRFDIGGKLEELTTGIGDSLGNLLAQAANALVGLLSQGVLVLLFLLFILLGRTAGTGRAGGWWGEVEASVNGYLLAKLLVSGVTGVLTFLILELLGIDLALLFGLFAFLLNFIPNVGSIIAVLLPLPIVVVTPDITWTTGILALALPGAVQFSAGNLLEPRLLGKSLDLHPIMIMIALIFWGMLWGIVGMLLAAPLTAVLKILLEKQEITRPVAELMAGRVGGQHT